MKFGGQNPHTHTHTAKRTLFQFNEPYGIQVSCTIFLHWPVVISFVANIPISPYPARAERKRKIEWPRLLVKWGNVEEKVQQTGKSNKMHKTNTQTCYIGQNNDWILFNKLVWFEDDRSMLNILTLIPFNLFAQINDMHRYGHKLNLNLKHKLLPIFLCCLLLELGVYPWSFSKGKFAGTCYPIQHKPTRFMLGYWCLCFCLAVYLLFGFTHSLTSRVCVSVCHNSQTQKTFHNNRKSIVQSQSENCVLASSGKNSKLKMKISFLLP